MTKISKAGALFFLLSFYWAPLKAQGNDGSGYTAKEINDSVIVLMKWIRTKLSYTDEFVSFETNYTYIASNSMYSTEKEDKEHKYALARIRFSKDVPYDWYMLERLSGKWKLSAVYNNNEQVREKLDSLVLYVEYIRNKLGDLVKEGKNMKWLEQYKTYLEPAQKISKQVEPLEKRIDQLLDPPKVKPEITANKEAQPLSAEDEAYWEVRTKAMNMKNWKKLTGKKVTDYPYLKGSTCYNWDRVKSATGYDYELNETTVRFPIVKRSLVFYDWCLGKKYIIFDFGEFDTRADVEKLLDRLVNIYRVKYYVHPGLINDPIGWLPHKSLSLNEDFELKTEDNGKYHLTAKFYPFYRF